MSKFNAYRILAPFRSRLQRRLRDERHQFGLEQFIEELGRTDARIATLLWELLRENAFVADFRPDPHDTLADVFAMGPEEVRDDLVAPILESLEIVVPKLNFRDVDFSALTTVQEVAVFVDLVAKQNG